MPYVVSYDNQKIQLPNFIGRDDSISMSPWELFEYPVLPTAKKHIRTVKTSN